MAHSPKDQPPLSKKPARSDLAQANLAGRAPPPKPPQNGSQVRPGMGPILPVPPEQLFSMATLRRAWLGVKRAGGGAGVDGVTIEKFEAALEEELSTLRKQLMSGNYQPRPIRRILVPKSSGGLRSLAHWALQDRIAQRAVYEIIAPSFEAIFLPCSYGFRPGLGVKEAIAQLHTYRDDNLRWVVDADIQNCFDSIDGARLLKLVAARVQDPLLLCYIERWLEARIFNTADGVPQKAGASQGSVLSPLLANIYLHPVDQCLMAQPHAFIRYADDLMLCCRRKVDAEETLALLQRALAIQALQLNPRKTWIRHFDDGFEWLGHFFVRRECYVL